MDDYWELLPRYQGVEVDDLKFLRILYGKECISHSYLLFSEMFLSQRYSSLMSRSDYFGETD